MSSLPATASLYLSGSVNVTSAGGPPHRAPGGSVNALRNNGDTFARRASAAIMRAGNEVNRSSIRAVNTDNNCERPGIDASIGVVSGWINNAQRTLRRGDDTLTQSERPRQRTGGHIVVAVR